MLNTIPRGGLEAVSTHLQVGIGVVHGLGETDPLKPTAEELARRALETVDTEQLLVRGVVLFATADWCRCRSNLSREVRSALTEQLGYDVPLIGGSMAKIYCWTDPEPVIDPGLLLVAICSNDIWITVGSVERPHDGTKHQQEQKVLEAARDLERRAGVRLGSGADRYLFGMFPGIIQDENGNHVYRDNELHQRVLAAFDFRYHLFGGAAADDIDPTTGYQFADDACLESGLALAIVESDLGIGNMMGHGFTKRRDLERVTVDALAGGGNRGYGVTKLNQKPARQFLEEHDRKQITWFGRSVFGLPGGPDCDVAVPLSVETHGSDTVWFNRQLSLGDSLFPLDSSADNMMESSRAVIESARRDAEANINELAIVLAFGCTARYQLYDTHGQAWQDVIESVRRKCPGVPLIFVLCAGEFGQDRWRRARGNNMSLSICCLSNEYARSAQSRNLENQLLNHANQLAVCQTPREVMEAALKVANVAGATGGQICIVDKSIGRIVGSGLGCAYRVPNSPHDWCAVADLTVRELSESTGGDFPSRLRRWARPVKAGFSLRLVPTLKYEEDILTLIVRTMHAIFVQDAQDPRYACDTTAANAGSINTQVAIPMVGSHGDAIATLQISFPDGTFIDGASFDAWIGYAQKAAVALELAYEAEERRITEKISELANQIIQAPVSLEQGPHTWCGNYVRTLRELLDADDVHMRLLDVGPKGDEYHLVAEDGFLKDIRFRCRRVTHEGDGSCNRVVLLRGGVITNSREETQRINTKVGSLAEVDQYGRALQERLDSIESTAMLPILHENQLLGSIVIDSKRRCFFTERRRRIARFAATSAGAILRGKTAEHGRLWLDSEQNWMWMTLAQATQASAGERLRWFTRRLCETLDADVASAYIWHESPRRLILHTSYNWDAPREHVEGSASYRLGEGWTGDLPLRQEEVSVVGLGLVEGPRGTRKYFAEMIPREHRELTPTTSDTDVQVPSIGLRLNTPGRPMAVITFTYYPQNIDQLRFDHSRKGTILKAFSQVLTLAIEAVNQEVVQQRLRDLNLAKERIFECLMTAAQQDGDWGVVVDAIRSGFSAQRVNFWPLRQDRLEEGWCSWNSQVACNPSPLECIEPLGTFREVVYRNRTVCATLERNPRVVEQWPDSTDVHALLAVPVICSGGKVRGVLGLVNRIRSPDHPFEDFDEYEQQAAEEIGRAIGAALDSREKQLEAEELASKLATAMQIGAASLSGAMVMHQLMTPFALIQSSVDWLRLHPSASQGEREEQLEQVQQSCSEAVSMIHQTTAKTALSEKRSERVRALVRQATEAVQLKLSQSRVRMKLHNDVKLRVHVDPYSIVGALVNLLSNALDAMEDTGTLTVISKAGDNDDIAVILVCNTGSVVTDEQIARFFQPGHSSKGSKEHLGFGLPVAKLAIEEAGGSLTMRPISGGGVEAKVTLPAVK